ncbi:MAG: hypothetical protein ACOYN0_11775 [Phycisphaerales bacterium]
MSIPRSLLLAVLVALACPLARAQIMAVSVTNPADYFRPTLQPHEIRVITRILNLAESEGAALLALYDGHAATLKARAGEISDEREEALEEAQATADLAAAGIPKETEDAWKAEAERATSTFFDDLKVLLTKEQADRWPLVERELRRFKSLGRGRIAGESLDVIRLVDEHAPAAWSNPEISGFLASYVQTLDAVIVRRDAQLDSPQATDFGKMAHDDRAAAETFCRDVTALRVAVRDMNLKAAEQVASLLPEGKSDAFRKRVFEAAYPRITKASRTERYIRAAAAVKSLSPQQQADINDAIAAFEVRLASVQKEQAALKREEDATKLPLVLRGSQGGATSATTADGEVITFYSPGKDSVDKESPAYKLQQRRFQLESETKRRINGFLTPEQRDACRQPPVDQLLFGEDDFWGL